MKKNFQQMMVPKTKKQRPSNMHKALKSKASTLADKNSNQNPDSAKRACSPRDTPLEISKLAEQPRRRSAKGLLKVAQGANLQVGSRASGTGNQTRKSTGKPSINRLRSYSPRVNLSKLQNMKAGASNATTTEKK